MSSKARIGFTLLFAPFNPRDAWKPGVVLNPNGRDAQQLMGMQDKSMGHFGAQQARTPLNSKPHRKRKIVVVCGRTEQSVDYMRCGFKTDQGGPGVCHQVLMIQSFAAHWCGTCQSKYSTV